LAGAVRAVLGEAIEAGGSSLKDYARTNGALGYFQHCFRVYDRQGRLCLTPGCGGQIAKVAQTGRSTFYCPICQR
jgi:formamidopyrimidine-DNA glycosylase